MRVVPPGGSGDPPGGGGEPPGGGGETGTLCGAQPAKAIIAAANIGTDVVACRINTSMTAVAHADRARVTGHTGGESRIEVPPSCAATSAVAWPRGVITAGRTSAPGRGRASA